MSPGKHVIYSVLALGIVLAWFESTTADIWLQDLLFNNASHTWLLDQPGKVVRLIFYDGIKILLVLSALAIIVSLLLFRKTRLVRQYHHGLNIVLVSMIAVPAVIGLLKDTTNVACPRDLIAYGGNIPYIKVFESYPVNLKPEAQQRCFPAGHASGGFALMSLYFLFQSRRNRHLGLLIGMLTGISMGTYKMIIGDHFLSHTLVTMIAAWLLINIIVIIETCITSRMKPRMVSTCC